MYAVVLLTTIHTELFAVTENFIEILLLTIDAVQRKFTIPLEPYVAVTRSLTTPIMHVVEVHTTIPLHRSAAATKCLGKVRGLGAAEHKTTIH